jgi:hypothetical protein
VKTKFFSLVIVVTIVALLIIIIYRAQDIKEIAIGIYKITFESKQSQKTVPPKDLPEQTKHNTPSEINQHTEGDQSPAVNIAPGGKANFNYNVPRDGKTKE